MENLAVLQYCDLEYQFIYYTGYNLKKVLEDSQTLSLVLTCE